MLLDEKDVGLSLGSSLPSYLLPGALECRALLPSDAFNMSLTDDRIMAPATAYSSTLTFPGGSASDGQLSSTLSSTSPPPPPHPVAATATHLVALQSATSIAQSPLAAPTVSAAAGVRAPPVSVVTPLPGSLARNLVDERSGYYV